MSARTRWERRRRRLETRQSTASTPGERLTAAVDYLRAALADAAVPEAAREQAARQATAAVTAVADRLTPPPGGSR